MKKNRLLTALVIVVLLVGAGLLSLRTEDARKDAEGIRAAEEIEVTFPRDVRGPRRAPKKAARDAPLDTARAPLPRRDNRDPIDAAMTAPEGEGAIFIEINAIRHSPIAERILRCREEEALRAFDDMKERLGIDPSEDVDRLALAQGVVGVSGTFQDLKLPDELGPGEAMFDRTRIYTAQGQDENGAPRTVHLARVGDELLLTGETRDDVIAAAARAEGRGEVGAPLSFQGAPGELYGRFGPAFLAGILGSVEDPVAQKLVNAIDGGVVRMTVDEHVSLSLDMSTTDDASGKDLAQAVGGAIAGARLKAAAEDDTRLAALLEKARVQPHDDGRFDVDLAVPGEIILDALGCDPDGKRRPGAPSPAPERPAPAPDGDE